MGVPFLPTISTLFIILSAVLVAIGWRLIIKGKVEQHKKTMLAAAWAAVAFLVLYLSRSIFIGNTAFGGPTELKMFYTIFLIFHILLAVSGAVVGVITIRAGLRDELVKHRRLGPIASVMWFFTAITGTVVYLLLYVIYDMGETTSVFRAIFGL